MTRSRLSRAALLLVAAATLGGSAPARADSPRRARPKAVATPDPRPDAALYKDAQQAKATLEASAKRQAQRPEWERVVLRYRRVVARYPQSAYSDNALLAVGDLYREMARRFARERYGDDAVQAYRALVSEYPSSRLGEKALFAVFEIAREGGERKELVAAGRAYLDAFPEGARATGVKSLLKKGAAVQEAALPAPPPPGLAQVFNLRFWSGESSTRVVLDVEKAVRYKYDRISDPDRLWIDLDATRLHPNMVGRSFLVGDGLLERIRIGQNRDQVVRVVLDFKEVRDHTIFYLENPTRLVIDVQGTPRTLIASGLPAPPAPSTPSTLPTPFARSPAGAPVARAVAVASPEPFDLPSPSPSPPARPASAAATPAPSPTAKPRPADDRPERLPTRRVAAIQPPAPSPAATPAPGRPAPIALDLPPPRRSPSAAGTAVASSTAAPSPGPLAAAPIRASRRGESEAPLPPQLNRAGSYSLARQLGLGARKIVIDAGHGGHDPGTIGRAGLQEKDLVLDVARRLEQLVRAELGAEVVMTRSTDVFVPLEERTAIANSKGADLFLSIHANSSRNSSARGVETYFLNFAQDPHAEAVAARENAISAATLKDLQNLVKAITLNSKIDESRDFASSVQEALFQRLRPTAPGLQDRGVRTAPFYVLIGANMPSILAEIAFVSNPEEERLLKTGDHRERIAQSLLEGVRDYLDSLSRTQTRQLTSSPPRSTVASGGSRR